jgi:hypothetical protein
MEHARTCVSERPSSEPATGVFFADEWVTAVFDRLAARSAEGAQA